MKLLPRRLRHWWADFSCDFVAAHGRWWVLRSNDGTRWNILKRKGQPPVPDGWHISANFMTYRRAYASIDTDLFWDALMDKLGPSGIQKVLKHMEHPEASR